MKPFYILLALLCLTIHCFSQNMVLREYAAYGNENKEIYFYDDFNDNKNDWLDADDKHGEIKNGTLVFKNIDTVSYYIEKAIDPARDFEIEFTARLEGAKKSYGVFGWGSLLHTEESGSYLFFKNNLAAFVNCHSGRCDEQKEISVGYAPSKKGFNVYTIRKTDSFYYVFVNEKFVLTHPYKPLESNILTMRWAKASLAFDALTISYLKTPALDSSTPNFWPKWGLDRYLKQNLRVNQDVMDGCVNTRFLLSVRVTENGRADSVISYSINKGLNTAIEKNLKYAGVQWIPAYKNNKPVTAWLITPVDFYRSMPTTCLGDAFYYRRAINAYAVEKNAKEAFNNFLDAAKANYLNLDAWYNLVVICINEEQFDKARVYLNLLQIAASYKAELTKDETDVVNSIPQLVKKLR